MRKRRTYSPEFKEEAIRLLALPSASVEVVPPLLNPIFRVAGNRDEDAEAASKLGVREPYVLAVASLEPRKNFGRLLDAQEPGNMLEKVFQVLESREDRIRTIETARKFFPIDFKQQVDAVNHKPADHKNSNVYMNHQGGFVAAEKPAQPLSPGGFNVHAGEACCPLGQE